jgi:hypothetical protein
MPVATLVLPFFFGMHVPIKGFFINLNKQGIISKTPSQKLVDYLETNERCVRIHYRQH